MGTLDIITEPARGGDVIWYIIFLVIFILILGGWWIYGILNEPRIPPPDGGFRK